MFLGGIYSYAVQTANSNYVLEAAGITVLTM